MIDTNQNTNEPNQPETDTDRAAKIQRPPDADTTSDGGTEQNDAGNTSTGSETDQQ